MDASLQEQAAEDRGKRWKEAQSLAALSLPEDSAAFVLFKFTWTNKFPSLFQLFWVAGFTACNWKHPKWKTFQRTTQINVFFFSYPAILFGSRTYLSWNHRTNSEYAIILLLQSHFLSPRHSARYWDVLYRKMDIFTEHFRVFVNHWRIILSLFHFSFLSTKISYTWIYVICTVSLIIKIA